MKYEPLEHIVLGQGPHGVVFKGHDTRNNRPVAIKSIERENDQASAWQSAMFVAGHMNRGLVQVWDIEQKHGWVVLELMSQSLQSCVDQKPLDPVRARQVLRDTLEGLAYLHTNGFAHGAIKPTNILLDEQGRAKLADARGYTNGTSWRLEDSSSLQLPPEALQSSFGELGPPGDLFCLANALMQALLGKKFERAVRGNTLVLGGGRDGWIQWLASTNTEYPSVAEIVPGLDPTTAKVLTRMLSKCASQRYRDAAEALAELDHASPTEMAPPDSSGNTISASQNTFTISSLGLPGQRQKQQANVKVVAGPGASVTGTQRRRTHRLDWIRFPSPQAILGLLSSRAARIPLCALAASLVVGFALWPSADLKKIVVEIKRNEASVVEYRERGGASFETITESHVALPIGVTFEFVAKQDGVQKQSRTETIDASTTSVDLTFMDPQELTRHRNLQPVKCLVRIIPPVVDEITLDGQSVMAAFGKDRDRLSGRLELENDQIPHTLTVKAIGYYPATIVLAERHHDIQLRPVRDVIVHVDPPHAKVFQNGSPLDSGNGVAKFSWPEEAENIVLSVSCEGYQPGHPIRIHLPDVASWPLVQEISLEKLPAEVEPIFSLLGVPSGGVIYVDRQAALLEGKPAKGGPRFSIDRPGLCTVTVVATGYERWEKQLNLVPGGQATVVMRRKHISTDNQPAYLAPEVVVGRH